MIYLTNANETILYEVHDWGVKGIHPRYKTNFSWDQIRDEIMTGIMDDKDQPIHSTFRAITESEAFMVLMKY